MPPKKTGAKGKGGKDKKDGGDASAAAKNELQAAKLQIEALERELVLRTEIADQAVAAKNELQARVREYDEDVGSERRRVFDITADMTRQYKAMEEDLLRKVTELELKIESLNSQLVEKDEEVARRRAENESNAKLREAEVSELKQKMEDMAIEFGDLLKDALDKMSERIELANKSFETESGEEIQSRLKEFHLDHVSI